MSVRQIDITFGDVVYWPARRALEHGLNPDVEEVVENNKLGKIRECADNGHPHRCEGANGRLVLRDLPRRLQPSPSCGRPRRVHRLRLRRNVDS